MNKPPNHATNIGTKYTVAALRGVIWEIFVGVAPDLIVASVALFVINTLTCDGVVSTIGGSVISTVFATVVATIGVKSTTRGTVSIGDIPEPPSSSSSLSIPDPDPLP